MATVTDTCERCGKATCEAGEDGRFLCDRCRAKCEYEAWYESAEKAIEDAAAKHGWTVELEDIAQTGSRYYAVRRECRGDDQTEQDMEDYGPTGLEKITVRLSDNGDCYCRANYSVAMNPSGDDGNLEVVLRRLAQSAWR